MVENESGKVDDQNPLDNGFTTMDDEDGKPTFACNVCPFKTNHARGIKCHISSKHKSPNAKPQDISVTVEDEALEEFGDGILAGSTQQPTDIIVTDADILREYNFSKIPVNDDSLKDTTDGEKDEVDQVMEEILVINQGNTSANDDTVDKFIRSLGDRTAKGDYIDPEHSKVNTCDDKPDLVTDNVILKSKIKELEEKLNIAEVKASDADEKAMEASFEVSELSEEVRKLKEEAKTKDEANEIIIAEKSSMEEEVLKQTKTVKKYSEIMHIMYQERNSNRKEIEKLKTTNELHQLGNPNPGEATTKITEKLKEKTNQLNIANENLKRLARDLANAENKVNDTGNPTVADDKYTKLTALLKTKSNEIRELKKENDKVSGNLKVVQEKLNASTNKIAQLDADKIRLEGQCDNLIEACGRVNANESVTSAVDAKISDEKPKVNKCIHNDKGRCRNGSSCTYKHSLIVCKEYSKVGRCKSEGCLLRHPVGVCLSWRRGQCDKNMSCFYRHPDTEFGSLGSNSPPEAKRRREQSPPKMGSPKVNNYDGEVGQSKTRQDHFLFQRVIELEMEKRKMMPMGPRYSGIYLQAPQTQAPPLSATQPSQAASAPSTIPWTCPAAATQPAQWMGPQAPEFFQAGAQYNPYQYQ